MRTWLEDLRNKKGFTMKQMGEALDISESYYCHIENGVRQKDMDITLVSKLSSVLSISISEIFEFEQN